MNQEHRFVAELYRYLAPFVDEKKDVYLILDGIAARTGVEEGRFQDADVPDLCFTLIGDQSETLLEAKIIREDGRVMLGGGQLRRWKSGGGGQHPPSAWVASNRVLDRFYYWRHDAFCKERLNACRSQGKRYPLRPPKDKVEFKNVRELALCIFRNTDENGKV